MFFENISSVREKMNEAGASKTPFLFILNFEMTEGYFVENPLLQHSILFQVISANNKAEHSFNEVDIYLKKHPVEYKLYQQKFDIIHKGLLRGDSFLANLTIKTPVETNLSLKDIFSLSQSPYQLYIPERFVCFSPERFVKIANGVISSNPMKGTIDAGIMNAEKLILSDSKETAEHNTIVDLIRNDLSLVADNVRVERFRYIDKISTRNGEILQVSSEIAGNLPADYQSHLGDIVFKLLPAGSISGAPKGSTVRLIRQAEQEDRGYYTGIFGYYDGASLDTAVMIRFIEQRNNRLYFRSGGGITAYSNCEAEYDEVLKKIYLPFV